MITAIAFLLIQELQELYSAVEEAKADIVGLWALRFLISQVSYYTLLFAHRIKKGNMLRENKYITGRSGVVLTMRKPVKGTGTRRETMSLAMHSIPLNFYETNPLKNPF